MLAAYGTAGRAIPNSLLGILVNHTAGPSFV